MELIKLINKNLKIIFRNKVSTFVILLGPLLIIFLAGIAFDNNNSYEIEIGTYSENYSHTADNFVEKLSEDFKIYKFESPKACTDAVKKKGYHGCILIPKGLEINENHSNELELYIDNSKINIVNAIKQKIFESIQDTSTKISTDLTNKLISTITFTEEQINSEKTEINSNIEKLNEITEKSSNSKKLLTDSNLKFNRNEIPIDNLKSNTSQIGTDFNNAKELAENAINIFDEAIEDIQNLSIENSNLDNEIDDAEDSVRFLNQELSNITLDDTNSITQIVSLTEILSDKIDTIEQNLIDARTKKYDVNTNLDNINKDISTVQDNLNKVLNSFEEILKVSSSNSIMNAKNIVQPVTINENEIVSGSKLNFLIPNLIILVIMFISIMMSSTHVINEKLNKAKMRMGMTPISFLNNTFATFISVILIIIIQNIILLTVIQAYFKIQITHLIGPIFLITTLAAIFFSLLGMAIGKIFNTQQGVTLAALSTSSLFLILSDVIFPLESMPGALGKIINVTPFLLSTKILRNIMFFSIKISSVRTELIILGAFSIAILIALLVIHIIEIIVTKYKRHKRKKIIQLK